MATEPIQGVLRAIRVLELFHEHSVVSASDCAEALDVSRATAHRLLVTLHEAGVLERADNGVYRLGLRLLQIGALAPLRKRLCDQSRVPMQNLAGHTGMSTNLGVRDDVYAVFIETVPSPRSRVPTRVGHRAPLHATGIGKLLLAYAPAAVVSAVIEGGLHPFTPFTITDGDALLRELDSIRARAAAFDKQEINLGVQCLAVPVRGREGDVIAGLSLSYPAALPARRQLDSLLGELRGAVKQIETGLGWQQSIDWSFETNSSTLEGA